MEVILSYLENMFLHMPKTPEVLRAKEELASMMEDKYNELLAEGKKENEAVGIVISEFGDLSELAEGLGLGAAYNGVGYGAGNGNGASYGAGNGNGAGYGAGNNNGTDYGMGNGSSQSYDEPAKMVSLNEAQEYIEASVKSSKLVALGVALCIYCPIPVLLMGGIHSYIKPMSDLNQVLLGIIPLLAMIGIAVGLFIANGTKMARFEYLKKERIQIDHGVENYLNEVAEQSKSSYTRNLIFGILMCIFSVVPVLIVGSLTEDSIIKVVSVILLLVMIGIGVMTFITNGSRMECMKVLKQEGDFSVRGREENKAIDVVAGIYWPIVTVIYLGWSFITMNWGFTWIIWPLAGILFGAIASICKAIRAAVKKEA